jgi:hypothetical protein
LFVKLPLPVLEPLSIHEGEYLVLNPLPDR